MHAAHNAKNLEVDETRIKSFDWNNIAKDFFKETFFQSKLDI